MFLYFCFCGQQSIYSNSINSAILKEQPLKKATYGQSIYSDSINSAILKEQPLKKATYGRFWKFQWYQQTTLDRLRRFYARNAKIMMHDLGLQSNCIRKTENISILTLLHPRHTKKMNRFGPIGFSGRNLRIIQA